MAAARAKNMAACEPPAAGSRGGRVHLAELAAALPLTVLVRRHSLTVVLVVAVGWLIIRPDILRMIRSVTTPFFAIELPPYQRTDREPDKTRPGEPDPDEGDTRAGDIHAALSAQPN